VCCWNNVPGVRISRRKEVFTHARRVYQTSRRKSKSVTAPGEVHSMAQDY
jgi:hypothetical protein